VFPLSRAPSPVASRSACDQARSPRVAVTAYSRGCSPPLVQLPARLGSQVSTTALLMHRAKMRCLCLGGGAETDLYAALAFFLLPRHLAADRSDPILRQIAQDRPYPHGDAPLGL